MIPAHVHQTALRAVVCSCGAYEYTHGTLADVIWLAVRRGWWLENRRWKCGACLRREREA